MLKQETIDRINKFVSDRDWDKYHSGVNLAKSISIEANELLEVFQWDQKESSVEKVKEELADVLCYCIQMSEKYGLDIDEIINEKMDKNEAKYPAEKVHGSAKKYNEY